MKHSTTLRKIGHIAAAPLLVFGLTGAGAQASSAVDGVGQDAAGLRKSDETLMHRGHDVWLASLKWVAEAK